MRLPETTTQRPGSSPAYTPVESRQLPPSTSVSSGSSASVSAVRLARTRPCRVSTLTEVSPYVSDAPAESSESHGGSSVTIETFALKPVPVSMPLARTAVTACTVVVRPTTFELVSRSSVGRSTAIQLPAVMLVVWRRRARSPPSGGVSDSDSSGRRRRLQRYARPSRASASVKFVVIEPPVVTSRRARVARGKERRPSLRSA